MGASPPTKCTRLLRASAGRVRAPQGAVPAPACSARGGGPEDPRVAANTDPPTRACMPGAPCQVRRARAAKPVGQDASTAELQLQHAQRDGAQRCTGARVAPPSAQQNEARPPKCASAPAIASGHTCVHCSLIPESCTSRPCRQACQQQHPPLPRGRRPRRPRCRPRPVHSTRRST